VESEPETVADAGPSAHGYGAHVPELESEWTPAVGYMTAQEAQRGLSDYLMMHRYHRIRSLQFKCWLAGGVICDSQSYFQVATDYPLFVPQSASALASWLNVH